jgi:ABC-type glutathione transport system ATPase component
MHSVRKRLIENDLKTKKETLIRMQAENDLLSRKIKTNLDRIVESTEKLEIGQEALQLLEDVANSRRSAMKDKIEKIITEALQLIYGSDYSVELEYDVKNNRSFLDIKMIKQIDGGHVKRNMAGFGGGVCDTISVPLRLLVLIGSKQTDKIAVLDECYKHVDPERIEYVSEFLKDISQKLGIQLILCSHHEIMRDQADAVYEISDDNGKSVIKNKAIV